jgi:hypothetical protein
MSQPDLFESSVKSKGFAQVVINVNKLLKQLAIKRTKLELTGLDVELVDKMLTALKEMTAEHWPDQVWALVDAEAVHPGAII